MDEPWHDLFTKILDDFHRDEETLLRKCKTEPRTLETEVVCSLAGTAILLLRQIIRDADLVLDSETGHDQIFQKLTEIYRDLTKEIRAVQEMLGFVIGQEPGNCRPPLKRLVDRLFSLRQSIQGLQK